MINLEDSSIFLFEHKPIRYNDYIYNFGNINSEPEEVFSRKYDTFFEKIRTKKRKINRLM